MSQVEPLTSPVLGQTRHAFFLRLGGVSTGIYASLNCGPGSSDQPGAVAENRSRVARAIGVAPDRLVTARQAHTAKVIFIENPWEAEALEADALVTDRPDMAVGALAADCAPILMSDSRSSVAAAVHAGWRGAKGGVIEAAVEAMVNAGARRERISAAIGPCAGPSNYEVGDEFESTFIADDPANATFFHHRDGERPLFDLPGYVRAKLAHAGVEKMEWIGVCALSDTRCFSSRRAKAAGWRDYGRMISVIRPG